MPIAQSSDLPPFPKVASVSARKCMKNLALFELILSIVAFCLGSTCTGINFETDHLTCIYGTGIWVGLLCTGRAIFGLAALNPMLRGKHRLLTAYFILCVISTVASCILAAISAMWIQRANTYWQQDSATTHLASYILNVLLLVLALLHIICCAVSAGIMLCYYFGCHFAVQYSRPHQRPSIGITNADTQGRQVCFNTNPSVITPVTYSHSSNMARNLGTNQPPPAYEDIRQEKVQQTNADQVESEISRTNMNTSV